MIERKPKVFVFRWAFWIGLMLFLSGILELFFPSIWISDGSVRYEPVFTFVGIVLVCVISPIIEEFGFRFWTKGKLWSYLVSIGSIIILGILSHALLLSFISALLFGLCYVLIKDNKKRVTTMIVVSSILFSVIHLDTYSVIKVDVIFQLLSFVGVGLISCFIAINFNFLWSIIFHILWNSIIITSFLLFWYNSDYSFETNNYKVDIEPMNKQISRIDYKGDTLLLTGPMMYNVNILCNNLLEEEEVPVNSRILYSYDYNTASFSRRYKMAIIDKSHGSASLNEVLRKMRDLNYVITDTTYEIMYRLEVGDPEKLANQSSEASSSIMCLLVSLRSENIPVIAGESVNVKFPLQWNAYEHDRIDSMDVVGIANYIYEKYGLELKKSDGELMQVIKISCGSGI